MLLMDRSSRGNGFTVRNKTDLSSASPLGLRGIGRVLLRGLIWAWGVSSAVLLFTQTPCSCHGDELPGLHAGTGAARSGGTQVSQPLGPRTRVVSAAPSFAAPPIPQVEPVSPGGPPDVRGAARRVVEPQRHLPRRLPAPVPEARQGQLPRDEIRNPGHIRNREQASSRAARSRSDLDVSPTAKSHHDPPRFGSLDVAGKAVPQEQLALRSAVPPVRRLPSIDAPGNDAASESSAGIADSAPHGLPLPDLPTNDTAVDVAPSDAAAAEPVAAEPVADTPLDDPSDDELEDELERGVDRGRSADSWSPVSIPAAGRDAADSTAEQDPTFAVIARRVMVLSRQAEDLASRGAYYAARAKMIESLRIITQALDSRKTGKRHSEALGRAKQAFREVGDFDPRGSVVDAELNVARIISGHRTKILRDVSVEHLTPLVVRQKYLEYAQRQFAEACDGLPIGSHALYGLGRVYAVMAHAEIDKQMLCLPKAVTLHQAALLVDSTNVQAANELGVLLARLGQLNDARRALRHAVSIESRSEIWMNLAAVHQRLGERELAREARENGTRMASRRNEQEPRNHDAGIKWVDPKTFSETRFWNLR